MNEVKQAWTSLLSSGTPTATGNSTGNGNYGNHDGTVGVISATTWYDAPAPVIIHGRSFRDDIMDVTNGNNVKNAITSFEASKVKRRTDERRVSRDSGIETIASLRRTFLDDFRRSNDVDGSTTDKMADAKIEGRAESRGGEAKTEDSVNDDSLESEKSRFVAVNDEVLYQNNVEAALNSFSKICAKDLDTSGNSSVTKNVDGTLDLDDDDAEEADKETDDMDDSDGVERRGRRRRTSSSSRRHSSSVELTAVTSVKTGDDGVPTICFSFLRTEENLKPYLRDIPIDDDVNETRVETSEEQVGEQLYDFPKSPRAKWITEVKEDDVVVVGKKFDDAGNGDGDCSMKLPQKRLLGDGDVGSYVKVGTSEDQLYDFPKCRVSGEATEATREATESTGSDGLADKTVPRVSVVSTAEKTTKSEEQLYDSPTGLKQVLSSTLKETADPSSPENDDEPDQRLESDSCESPTALGLTKRTFRSLRSGRSIGTLGNSEDDHAATAKGYHSEPEVDNAERIHDADGEPQKTRKNHRRLGKAWGKMRTWLREEKSRFGDVVTRHARMQAVGASKLEKSDDASSLGARTGSYDLVEARTRELGSITRVEEFGLSSVSEEGNASGEPERPDCTSYDLHTDVQSPMEIGENDDDNVVVVGKTDKTKNKLDSSNDSPDAAPARFRMTSAVSTGNMLTAGTRMKLTPVSFSLEKLCADGGNDETTPDGTIVGHRDGDQTRDHVGKGGLIRRRMLGSIRGLMASTHLLQQHETEEGGPGGFEDVRRYVKQGGDFCKELAAILHERAELEASYSKGLSKLSCKLTKACTKDQGGNCSGGVTEAWRNVGEEMEAAAEAHRAWGIALSEQLAKPLRVGVAEAQGRSRKAIESSVDKASKSLLEWRGIAAKSKKQSFACARENERLQDLARIQSITQSQQNNNKTSGHHMTEKEVNKLETRRRKAEDSSRRADTEFYTVSVRAERARLEYESTVRKGAKQMELLEEERLSALKDLANVYLAHLQALAPKLQQSADRLSSPVRNCSVSQDVEILKNVIRRLDGNDASNVDQLLPDFYAEHVTLAMNRERRKQSLVRVLHLIRQDLERERRGREGLETLHRAFIQTPAFAADESTQNVTEKLHHMRSMLTFLEAARYKVGGTLAEVEGGKRGKHPLAEHILVSRDKQGLQQSVLKVPSWAKSETFEFPEVPDDLEIDLTKDHESEQRDWVDRTAGDGNSENPPDEEDFSDFDEFSSQSEDNNNQDVEIADMTDKSDRNEQCRAIYQYSANLNDELSLTPGDLINIHEKQTDGWWIGECSGRTGIFPATYVEIIH